MDDCIFCKIVNNEIPNYTVYEDDIVKAFLDISQTTPGHTLVVPKKHVADIYDYDAKMAEQVFARIPKIARAIKNSAPDIKGMNIINNNGRIASQSVFHSHFHLIPRYSEDDGFALKFTDNSNQYNEETLTHIQKDISKNLEG
ncbi:HIT family protein [Apilactobacillus timberlakei]|uniref:HIT family protein n=1 Tax=Apilactobacillus timberlakei TaxID=2008380 RepID=UPI001127D691|nr:HIT family protein [Apilactobacillus timberlakei]TPR16905.1 HIT family protein [Apilactobacillus timberlakei]TPR20277.1 HIT family protein [Apilactobacillus timberlakei]TPR21995.1 HIT family protein [Apilactobacillus timberlakei]TPR22396.1 HIT family protein [Apilactobacillus timberlakei]TPR24169.1 HIT family protein [Apilactobacillus timberlakei]